ncbi:MAG: endonuclease/exonuclease/phosphatase family protein [Candidatus Parabeggiatoa sp. nov. 3]|nr:MAG: endonuclease/exonuclease/phosphatase family protein [Gammaproteobacteria bacterium]RKZ87057.1 MAG: endonuclease/exonuclease/phosphatase family protein [Gammaproteobacteria bacterium]HEW97060.1 endonuclease/exonuclease/phosphatase family protein [Beggiatoa sp.]
MKPFFLKRIKWLVAIILLFSLTGYLGTRHWTFELTSHFKVQYFALSVLCVLICLWLRQWGWASLSLLGLIINGIVVLPWYFPSVQNHIQNHSLSILLSNVNIKNKNYSALVQLVAAENPDILIVQEGNRHWIKHLKVLEKTLPYVEAPPNSYFFGTVIYSRFPFEETQMLSLGRSGRESILVKIKINHKMVSLLTTHPLPPIPEGLFEHRNSQLFEVQSFIKQLPTPKMLIGDLNISMWSPFYSQLTQETRLINARQGFGILPTWPTFLPVLMIPIDHCLVSPDIKVMKIKTGESIGSDHLPLIVEVAI